MLSDFWPETHIIRHNIVSAGPSVQLKKYVLSGLYCVMDLLAVISIKLLLEVQSNLETRKLVQK